MDQIPSGHVPLCEAFSQLLERLHPDTTVKRHDNGAPKELLSDKELPLDAAFEIIVRVFQTGELKAQVYGADVNRSFALMPGDFNGTFPQRMFLAPEITALASDLVSRYSGRTPYTSQVALSNWLRTVTPFSESLSASGASETQFQFRNYLFARVARGELEPEDAEREAETAGCGPLNRVPAPPLFDPMCKSRWSIPMVIEWIMSRNADDVRQVDNEYRAECREWRFRKDRVPAEGGDSREQNGWVLEELHPITTNSLELWLEPTGCRRALAELWGKLQQEELIAEGLPCSGGPRVKIPSLEWSDLEPREEGRAREYFGYRHEPWGRTYTDVLVKR